MAKQPVGGTILKVFSLILILYVLLYCIYCNRPVGQVVTHLSLEWKVQDSNLRPVKLDTVLPTACYRCDISSKAVVLPERNDGEVGPANLLHASA